MNIIMLDCSNTNTCFYPKQDEKKMSFDIDIDEKLHINLTNSYNNEKNGIYMLFIRTDDANEYLTKMNITLSNLRKLDFNYKFVLLVNIISKKFTKIEKYHMFASHDNFASVAISNYESDTRNLDMFRIIKKKLEYIEIKDFLTDDEKYEYLAQI